MMLTNKQMVTTTAGVRCGDHTFIRHAALAAAETLRTVAGRYLVTRRGIAEPILHPLQHPPHQRHQVPEAAHGGCGVAVERYRHDVPGHTCIHASAHVFVSPMHSVVLAASGGQGGSTERSRQAVLKDAGPMCARCGLGLIKTPCHYCLQQVGCRIHEEPRTCHARSGGLAAEGCMRTRTVCARRC
jgi:hypothetical protein